ncbi:MAG: nucleotidyltransferase domain-containing protein [Clostridiales bacterium]|jgi:predicted nucleotidyltransferase|nr:nucleotidyltransferase domain-containing protein [Clostridiales bacterium]
MRLSDVTPKLTDYINENISALPEFITRIILFGSYARGTARVGSDIDLALVAQNTWTFEDRTSIRNFFEDFDCELSFFFTTENGLNSDDKNNANFWIRTEGIELWKRS